MQDEYLFLIQKTYPWHDPISVLQILKMSEEIQEMIDHRTIRQGINGELEVLLFSTLSKVMGDTLLLEIILELSAAEKITVSPEATP